MPRLHPAKLAKPKTDIPTIFRVLPNPNNNSNIHSFFEPASKPGNKYRRADFLPAKASIALAAAAPFIPDSLPAGHVLPAPAALLLY